MPEDQLKAFWEAIQSDNSLQEKLRATTDPDSIVSLAKEAGFEITADDIKTAKEAMGELSDEQLEKAVGGCCACNCMQLGVDSLEMDDLDLGVDSLEDG